MKLGKESRIALWAVVLTALLAVAYALLPMGGGGRAVSSEPVEISQAEYDRGLAEMDAAKSELRAVCAEVVAQMERIAASKRHDEEALKSDPEWCALSERLAALNAEYKAARVDMINFRKTHTVVGQADASIEEGISK